MSTFDAPGAAPPPVTDVSAAAGAGVPAARKATYDHVGAAPPAEVAGAVWPAPVVTPVVAPAAAQPRTTRPRPDDGQRVGTWRGEERQYVTEVILRFGEGRLPNVPDNTSLRVLLSNVLNCSPMRISKKFSGRNALPRGRYRRAADPDPEAAIIERLRALERAFHRCVRDDGAALTTSLCGTCGLPTPKAITDAMAAAAGAVRVASGEAGGRKRPRSRTVTPADLRAPIPASGGPTLARPYTGGGALPPPVPAGDSAKIAIAIVGLLDLAH